MFCLGQKSVVQSLVRQTNKNKNGQKYKQTNRQTDRQSDRETDRRTSGHRTHAPVADSPMSGYDFNFFSFFVFFRFQLFKVFFRILTFAFYLQCNAPTYVHITKEENICYALFCCFCFCSVICYLFARDL